MLISRVKSCIFFVKEEDKEANELGYLFYYKTECLSNGMTYLGFRLKPTRYTAKD